MSMPLSYHRQWNICDKSFEVADPNELELSILLSQDGVSFSVANASAGKVLALETGSFFKSGTQNNLPSWLQICDFLAASQDEFRWLNLPLGAKRLYIETRKSTLVPQSLAGAGSDREVLGFNHPLSDDEEVLSDTVASAGIVNLFALPGEAVGKLSRITGCKTIHCGSSVLLELLLGQFKNLKLDDKLFVHVRPRWFELVYLRDKKLRFFNSFEYQTREDFAYFLLFVMDQLGLSPETTEVVLLGEIEKESEIFRIVYRYVRNVGFARRLTALEFPFVFDELPRHGYFTILNTSLCAL